jgi:hypothetical protein
MITWAELKDEFLDSLEQINGLLARSVAVCESFENLLAAIESIRKDEERITKETIRNLGVLERLALVTDTENIPPEIVMMTADIYMRVQYIISVFIRVNQMQGMDCQAPDLQKKATPTHEFPKGLLH